MASDKTSKERRCPVQEGGQAVECQQQPQEPKGAGSPKAGSDHSEPKYTIAGVLSGNQPHLELRRVVCQGNQEQNTDDKGKAEPFQAISKYFQAPFLAKLCQTNMPETKNSSGMKNVSLNATIKSNPIQRCSFTTGLELAIGFSELMKADVV
jgi:hypothetical protein